jgi:hypothetical protein
VDGFTQSNTLYPVGLRPHPIVQESRLRESLERMAWARMLRWGTRLAVVAAIALPVAALLGEAALAALYEMLLLAFLAARWAAARPRHGLRRLLAAFGAAMAVVAVFVAAQLPLAHRDSLYSTNVLIAVSLEVLLAQALLWGAGAYWLMRGFKRVRA